MQLHNIDKVIQMYLKMMKNWIEIVVMAIIYT